MWIYDDISALMAAMSYTVMPRNLQVTWLYYETRHLEDALFGAKTTKPRYG